MGLMEEALKQGGVPEGFKEVEVDFYRFKTVGDFLTGKLISKAAVNVGPKGNRTGKYTILDSESKMISFLGSAELDEKMARIAIGATVLVQYIGSENLEEGRELKHFRALVK